MKTYRLLFHTAATEIRLTLRNPGFWLFLFFITVLTGVVLFDVAGHSSLTSVVEIANNILFFQFPLIAIVVSPAITRHRSLSREWVWATRLDYAALLVGQFIGLTVIFLVSSLLPIIVMSFWLFQTALYLPALWGFGLLLILPVTFLEICAAFSFACWFRNTVLAVALVTALVVLERLGILVPVATLLAPLNYTLLTLHLDSVVGLGAEKPILASLLLFYVFLGAGGVMASIWGSSQISSYGESQPAHKSFVMLGMLVGFAGIFLTFRLYTLPAKQSIVPPPPLSSQIDVWDVEAASHIGSISGAEINLQSEFTLRNMGDTSQNNLLLSLNTGQSPTDVTVDGSSASFKRLGEFIEILLPSPVNPDGAIRIKMAYAGFPLLLREDYSLQLGLRNNSPPSFQNSVQTYLDKNTIYLHRDGNWMAWPLSADFHLSSDDVIILEIPKYPYGVSSGEIIEETDTYIKYRWKGRLPQILLALAPYYAVEQPDNTLFLGQYSDKRSLDHAYIMLDFVKELDKAIKFESDRHYTIVALPYAQETVISDVIIGLPSYKDAVNISYEARIYDLASSVTRAWLKDKISWPGDLTSEGYLRGSETICEMPDENGRQKCEVISNDNDQDKLQVPYGRLVNKTSHNPLLNAISVVLSWRLAEDMTGNNSLTEREYEKWLTRAECDISVLSAWDKHQAAGWIVLLRQAFDTNDLEEIIQALIENYPPGSSPVTESEFVKIAQNYKRGFEAPIPCDKFIIGNMP